MQHTNSNRIFLIRHARPQVSKKGLFNAAAASQFISDYDTAAVEDFVLQHETIPFGEIERVYCSTLVRSQLTAKAIFGEETELLIDARFREFERKIFQLPMVRLPLHFWMLSARALWLMGFNSEGIETFKQAKARARECATLLITDAEKHHTTVLVAHGLLNRFISAALEQQGWRQVKRGGSGFLSVSIFEK